MGEQGPELGKRCVLGEVRDGREGGGGRSGSGQTQRGLFSWNRGHNDIND